MESNQNSNLTEEERAAAERLHTRLRRLSEVPNMEGVVISMFEFYAHLPTAHLTPIQEELLSLIEQKYGVG
ncbi:hypothetical protein DSM106972_027100 [Dulcicalothrix desertica PCC 7102]|uniref:Uncharacterized protein n=1 Tax=Dulcicalothrix desertica PCC 7102 TaxID=232991 RepID=A0A433VJZ7_9CYAN|nr:hypothetical protein [Dulcicalothrix desertica]RUT06453.1 hypothetical protein DSM106972_027100 [Dulcicalothrix desertica PCC 7102]TWH62655.1 hypothetical protein CAL7102_00157 [Dulcicalothrix desertica PCC 7102]